MLYQTIVEEAKHKEELLKPDRFVKISERKDHCDIPLSAWKPLLKNSFLQTWKGIILNKGVTEIGLYPMLLHELQPKTIIEIGAFNGGSAVWLADNLELFGVQGHIYSMDIDLSLLDEKAKTDPRICFLQGDCNQIESVFSPQMLAELAHPWLVIEDVHVNLVAVVDYFHKNGLSGGDYMIVEDTNQFMWEAWRENWDDEEELQKGASKMDELRGWLLNHEEEYLVDTYYQDIYGYNGSKNWNSMLKRV